MSRHSPEAMQAIYNALARYMAEQYPLPGIRSLANRQTFAMQVIDSQRRVEYVAVAAARTRDAGFANPEHAAFDPLKAAMISCRAHNIDEACWLVFLFVHFGRHPKAEWRFAREVYGRLGHQPHWTWAETSANPQQFRDWLRASQDHLLRGSDRGFGNHRKYQSMDADKPVGTGSAVCTYVNWVTAYGGHRQLFDHALEQCEGDARRTFDWLYRSMGAVASFGRTARFDYLTMLGKLRLAAIEPGKAYLSGATGPLSGARLMLQGSMAVELPATELEARLSGLARYLGVGMQVIEDSLCNWQKSPDKYVYFSG